MTSLLRDRLGDKGAFTVVNPMPGTNAITVDEAVRGAVAVNAPKAIIGSVTRLSMKLIVSYKLIDVPTGRVEFSDHANLTPTEDLDLAADRIAQALREQKPFSKTGEQGKLTEAEIRKTTALSSIFVTTGYTYPLDHRFPYSPGNMLFTLNAAVTYETQNVLAAAQMGLRRGKSEYNEIYFDLLVHKMFSEFDVSPFVGGGIGVHRYKMQGIAGEVNDDGLALVASGGVILFRSQYFRLLAGLKGTAVFTEDFGSPIVMGSLDFGLSSPTVGPRATTPDGLAIPGACIYTTIGAFFLTGLIVALTT
jgi:hypothetical protein